MPRFMLALCAVGVLHGCTTDLGDIPASGDAGRTSGAVATTPDAGAPLTAALTPAAAFETCPRANKWAVGLGSIEIGTGDSTLTVQLVHFNLSGAPKHADLHFGEASSDGPVVLDLGDALASPIRKTFSAASYQPADERAPETFAAWIKAVKAGQSYLDIHTAACPMGEIRGQLQAVQPTAARRPVTFAANLTPDAEVKACAGAAASARAYGTASISADRSKLTVDIQVDGLSGAPTQAHVHARQKGMDGPAVLDLGDEDDLGPAMHKVFTQAQYVRSEGAPADFGQFLSALEAGGAYLNVHSAACPDGEIRGQLSFQIFDAKLVPGQETKSCSAAGASAQAAGRIFADVEGTSLELQLSHGGLSSPVTRARMLVGARGKDGPAVFDFGAERSWPLRKTVSAANYIKGPDAPADFTAFRAALQAGNAYFDLATEACADGEVRGQIE